MGLTDKLKSTFKHKDEAETTNGAAPHIGTGYRVTEEGRPEGEKLAAEAPNATKNEVSVDLAEESSLVGHFTRERPAVHTEPIVAEYGDYANYKPPTHPLVANDTIDNDNPLYTDSDQARGQGTFYDPKDTQGTGGHEATNATYFDNRGLKTEPAHVMEKRRKEVEQHDKFVNQGEQRSLEFKGPDDDDYTNDVDLNLGLPEVMTDHNMNKSVGNAGGVSEVIHAYHDKQREANKRV